MKRLSLLLALALSAGPAFGQEQKDADTPVAAKKQYNIDINNLPEETRQKYFEAAVRAEQLFGQKRIFECLETLRKANKIYSKNPATLNLEGACYVEFRDFDLAEIEFVTHDWPSALKKLTELKGDKQTKNFHESMIQLIDFKILLCQLKTGKLDAAQQTIGKLSYKDDTPLFYYGKAALAYQAEETAEAEKWLARGRRVFRDPTTLAPWQDTLIEFGYIKSFYGGDLETSE